jgi:serine/threonine protein kinase/WD40 repeat protein
MKQPEPSSLGSTESLEYANLLEQLSDTVRAGRSVDWTEVAIRYPQWLERLKEELQTIQTLLDAGNKTSSDLSVDEIETGRMPEIEGYQLLRRVGTGGMGVVYEAVELSLQRKVAIKILSAQLRPNSRVRIRFENEASAAGRLNHPNILPVYQIGESAGLLYYVMPYVDGQTLSEIAQSSDRSYASIATIVYQVANALEHAHESGVFHRDVKPSNIMLDRHAHVWLLDFGLAALDDNLDLTQTGEIIGTLRYMSPERLAPKSARTIDRRLDVYSLGATLYELLAGLPPYHDISKPALNKAIQETSPISLKQLAPNTPSALIRICEKAMERDPVDRYSNCLELGQDLERFLTGNEVLARPLSRVKRTSRLIRQNAFKLLATLGLSILFLGFTVVMLQRSKTLELQDNTIDYQKKLVEIQSKDLQRQKFYLELTKLRENRESGVFGWRAEQLETLKRLAGDERSDEELSLLRKEWIATSRSVDVQEKQVLLTDRSVFRCEWNKLGTQLAAGVVFAEAGEPMLMVYSGEPLRLQFEVSLPTPLELGVGQASGDGVRSVCFSEDHRLLWVGTRYGLVHEVDMGSGKVMRSKLCHSAGIFCLATFDEVGELITGGSDQKIRIWDQASFEEKQAFDSGANPSKLTRLNDTVFFFAGPLLRCERDSVGWSRPVRTDIDVSSVASSFSENSQWIYDLQTDGIKVVSRDNAEITRRFSYSANQSKPTHTNAHKVVACEGGLLFSTDSNGVKMWDMRNGMLLATKSIANNENAGVSCRPGGKEIAVWGKESLAIYQIQRSDDWGATEPRVYPVDSFEIQDTKSIAPAGLLVSARSPIKALDSEEYSVEYIPWNKQESIRNHGFGIGPVQLLGTFGTGFVAHQTSDEFVMWLNWHSQRYDQRYTFPFDSEFFSCYDASQNVLYCSWRLGSDKPSARVRYIPELAAVRGADRKEIWRYKPIKSHEDDATFTIKKMVSVSGRLYLLCDDLMIRELDAMSGAELRAFSMGDIPSWNVSSLGSKHLILGGTEGDVSVIDLSSGRVKEQKKLHENGVTSIQGIGEDVLVSGGIDGDLVISRWAGNSIEEVVRVPHANTVVDRIRVTADGNRICYLCRNEYAVRYLDWKKLVRELNSLQAQ